MFYSFRCPLCGGQDDIWQRMNDLHVAECPHCVGVMMERAYNAQIIGDEIKSGVNWDRKKRAMVKTHGDYFDIGLGCHVESKSHRRAMMKKLGVHEHPDAHLKEAPGYMGDDKGRPHAST